MPDSVSPADRTVVTGLILAGGQGLRLGGVDKSRLKVGGVRLAEHVRHRLAPQCFGLFVLTGARSGRAPDGLIALPDSGRGPAQAIIEAVRELSGTGGPGNLVLTASIDAPLVPTDLAARLGQAMDAETDAVVAGCAGRTYPTHALYRSKALLKIAESRVDFSDAALFGLLDGLRWRQVDFPLTDGNNPFGGINRSSELVATNRRLAGR